MRMAHEGRTAAPALVDALADALVDALVDAQKTHLRRIMSIND
jgi:hypothetical protein